jgi:hypothetical protein
MSNLPVLTEALTPQEKETYRQSVLSELYSRLPGLLEDYAMAVEDGDKDKAGIIDKLFDRLGIRDQTRAEEDSTNANEVAIEALRSMATVLTDFGHTVASFANVPKDVTELRAEGPSDAILEVDTQEPSPDQPKDLKEVYEAFRTKEEE